MIAIAQIPDHRAAAEWSVAGVGALQHSFEGTNGHGFDFAALFAAFQSREGLVLRHSSPNPEATPAFDDVLPSDPWEVLRGEVESPISLAILANSRAIGSEGLKAERGAGAVQSAEALLKLLPPAEPRAASQIMPPRPEVQILVEHMTVTLDAIAQDLDLFLSPATELDRLVRDDINQVLDLANDPEHPIAAAFGDMMQTVFWATQAQWQTYDWDITDDLAHPPVCVLVAIAFDLGGNPTSLRISDGPMPFIPTFARVEDDITLSARETSLKAPQVSGMLPAAPSLKVVETPLTLRNMGDLPLTIGTTVELRQLPEPMVRLVNAELPVDRAVTPERPTKDVGIDATLERADALRVLPLGVGTNLPKPMQASAQPYPISSQRALSVFAEPPFRAVIAGMSSDVSVEDNVASAIKPANAVPVATYHSPLPLSVAEPALADLGLAPAVQSLGRQMAATGGGGTSSGISQGHNLPAVLDLQRQGWTKTLVNRAAGLSQGGGTLILKILPQHLGQITLKLTEGRRGMDLRIIADVPSTAAMLRGIETQISSAFEEAGLWLENYSAQTGREGGGASSDGEPQEHSNGPDALVQEPLADENPQPYARGDKHLLNIVL
jgi:hypothetical protein